MYKGLGSKYPPEMIFVGCSFWSWSSLYWNKSILLKSVWWPIQELDTLRSNCSMSFLWTDGNNSVKEHWVLAAHFLNSSSFGWAEKPQASLNE